MEATQDYSGLKLGDKKLLKEAVAKEDPVAQEKRIKAKLGDEWTFVFDWQTIIKETTEVKPGEIKMLKMLYLFVLPAIADEIEKLDPELVDALNKHCTPKVFNFTMGKKSDSYKFTRYNVGFANGFTMTWNPDSYVYNGDRSNYPYNEKSTFTSWLMENVQTDDMYSGMTLEQKKKTQDFEAKCPLAESEKRLKAKLGDDWTFVVDWANLIKEIKITKPGDLMWIGQIYTAGLPQFCDEIEKMDEDVTEALNDACKKHVWTLTCGPKGGDKEYKEGSGRYRIEPLENGVTIVWNSDRYLMNGSKMEYPYNDKHTVTNYVLENC
jgi:hypothetical protein